MVERITYSNCSQKQSMQQIFGYHLSLENFLVCSIVSVTSLFTKFFWISNLDPASSRKLCNTGNEIGKKISGGNFRSIAN